MPSRPLSLTCIELRDLGVTRILFDDFIYPLVRLPVVLRQGTTDITPLINPVTQPKWPQAKTRTTGREM